MPRIWYAYIIYIVLASSALSEGAPVMTGRILLTGPQLAAAATALTRFRTEERKSDLARFIIEVRETAEFFEVMFGPEHVDVYDPETGQKMILRGGGNVHGTLRTLFYFQGYWRDRQETVISLDVARQQNATDGRVL